MELEVSDRLVVGRRVLEPGEGRVLEPDPVLLDRRLDRARDVSVDELRLVQELVDSTESDDCRSEGVQIRTLDSTKD